MLDNKTFLAIIPARGGSKRLKDKNILPLGDKPLIAHSIESGLASKYIDNVVVSSDSDTILEIAKKYGAKRVKRPDFLASDTATTFDAVKHTLKNFTSYDYIVLLQATSPLRSAEHIDEAIELLQTKSADAIVSVCEMDHSPLWSNRLGIDASLEGFIPDEIAEKRSQDLEQYFRINGAIYICHREKLLQEKSFFIAKNIFAYKMDKHYSVDIDEALDFKFAELILSTFEHFE